MTTEGFGKAPAELISVFLFSGPSEIPLGPTSPSIPSHSDCPIAVLFTSCVLEKVLCSNWVLLKALYKYIRSIFHLRARARRHLISSQPLPLLSCYDAAAFVNGLHLKNRFIWICSLPLFKQMQKNEKHHSQPVKDELCFRYLKESNNTRNSWPWFLPTASAGQCRNVNSLKGSLTPLLHLLLRSLHILSSWCRSTVAPQQVV